MSKRWLIRGVLSILLFGTVWHTLLCRLAALHVYTRLVQALALRAKRLLAKWLIGWLAGCVCVSAMAHCVLMLACLATCSPRHGPGPGYPPWEEHCSAAAVSSSAHCLCWRCRVLRQILRHVASHLGMLRGPVLSCHTPPYILLEAVKKGEKHVGNASL